MANDLLNILDEGAYSLVIRNAGVTRTFKSRGVRDLHTILTDSPSLLQGAEVADKIIGLGAAMLMIHGGVARVSTHTVSRPALEAFSRYGIPVSYESVTAGIINRRGDGPCPVETLCSGVGSPAACYELITNFLAQ